MVPVGQEHRPAPGRFDQVGRRGHTAGERLHGPAATQDPVIRAERAGAVRDDPQVPGPVARAGQVAAQALQPAADRVDVRVAERGDGQPAAQVDDPGARAHLRPGLRRGGQGGDPAALGHDRVAARPGPVR